MKRPKRLPTTTPITQVKHALRLLWLRSRERAAALKRDGYTCQSCHRKQSSAKGKEFRVEVHHRREAINWDQLAEYLRRNLLCEPDKLVTLCPDCHKAEHEEV